MPIHLLDTNHMSILERDSVASSRLQARMLRFPQDDIATTVVSYEEQTRGWLAVLARARTPNMQVAAYLRLKRSLSVYCRFAVIQYDEEAAAIFEQLRVTKIRIGTMDLKIASIAIANDATLLTRNLQDFSKVPGLKVEDWSV
jgi:tRNA(fMet)-specific endonuclease VapC